MAAALGPERFHQEIKIAANLTHPHILPLLDSGDVDGFLYYAMPYIEGESLRDKLAHEGELPIGEAVRILRDVVDALSEAHAKGVVHRDIKPDNVLLTKNHALVTDFGVAKAVSEATGARKLTTEGVALGTPAYMSPEQAAADKHIDHRADIYAVGALAYEVLTGRPPFTGTTPQEVLAAHVTKTVEPVTEHRGTVPPALAQLVMKCLEKKPADRWQSAEELLSQLEALATPSTGITPTDTAPVDHGTKRRWTVAVAAAALAVTIGVIAVVATKSRTAPTLLDPSRIVVAVFDNETGDESLDHLGRMVADWITNGLVSATGIHAVPWPDALQAWRFVTADAAAGRGVNLVRSLAEETGAATVVSGRYYLERDTLLFRVDVTDAREGKAVGGELPPIVGSADASQGLVVDVRERVLGFLAVSFDERVAFAAGLISSPPTFEAYRAFNEGMNLYIDRQFAAAREHFARATRIDSSWVAPLILLMISQWNFGDWAGQDSVLRNMSRLESALTEYERAWVGHLRAWSDGDIDRALIEIRRAAQMAPGSKAVYNLASAANRANRPQEAIGALLTLDPTRGAMRGWRRYWTRLTDAYHMLGEYELELEAARTAEAQYPDGHWRIAPLAALGRIDELSTALDELHAEADPPTVRYQIVRAAEILRAGRDSNASLNVAERAITWLQGRPADEVVTGDHRITYGWMLYLSGRVDEAREVFDALVEGYPNRWECRGRRAFLAAVRGDTARAIGDAEWFAHLAEPHMKGFNTYWRGVIAGALGNSEEAVALFRRAYRQGREFLPNDAEHAYLDRIRDHPGFQEFMRPRG